MFIATDAINSDKYYTLYSEAGTVLEFSNENKEDGGAVQTGSCHDMPWQQWKIVHKRGNCYKIVNRYSGKCIDICDGNAKNGTRLSLCPSKDKGSQLWGFRQLQGGRVEIFSSISGRNIDMVGELSSEGNRLQLWNRSDTPNQKWYILEAPSSDVILEKSIKKAFECIPHVVESLSEKQKSRYLQQIHELQKRYNDPEFKLAVIGNFSTGKSTFLNALIGQELLSVSNLPTTAIPTYMRWINKKQLNAYHIKKYLWKKQDPVIKILSKKGKEYILDEGGTNRFHRDTGILLPDSIGEQLDYVTTSASLIGKIERIDIFFPEREGFENVCLIDTPGINPGDEENKEHIIQTQMVLKEDADAAIILYTAKDAMTKDTLKFMQDNADSFMTDAIIVLTKMDLAPEKQREKIVRNTIRLVKEQYHQNNPSVYSISAEEALKYACGYSDSESAKAWSDNFEFTINDIMAQLGRRRNEIVSSRIAVLITKMINSISQIIKSESDELVIERQLMEKASVRNLETEFREMYKEYEREMKTGSSERSRIAETIVAKDIQEKRDKIFERIEKACNRKELNECNDYYKSVMSGADKEIIDKLRSEIGSGIERMNERYTKKTEECLEKYNRYLGDIVSKTADVASKENKFSSVTATFGTSSSFLNEYAALLVAAGVAMMIPGFNILVLAGGFILDAVRFNSKKEEMKSNVKSSLEDYKGKLMQACRDDIKRTQEQNLDWAKNLLNSYRERYLSAFTEIENNYNNHKTDVENRLERNRKNSMIMETLREKLSVNAMNDG